ncbi:hypothetical protein CHS0354_022339 [Potamilus streckersoni]|uniref:Uncharacterized protein n=1 Tax=Potamilus streckersoni TaxID=2493646 RepID=A0AAE0TIZ0_9BIVA|nr:hypothetical protein CHS0354_022339 [Potamilus streckersoni]
MLSSPINLYATKRCGKSKSSSKDSLISLNDLQKTGNETDQSTDMDQSRGFASIDECGITSPDERVETNFPILQYEKFIDLKQFVKDELHANCAIIMEEMKRMRKDVARLDEMIQSKDEKIKRLESGVGIAFRFRPIWDCRYNRKPGMVIEKLQAVNEKQVETVIAQIRVTYKLYTVVMLLCLCKYD